MTKNFEVKSGKPDLTNLNFIRFVKSSKIAIIALLITNILTAGWLLLGMGRSPEEATNPYPFLDPSRNFIPQKDFIVNIQPLREELYLIVEREKGNYQISLYFEFLNTGANVSINPDLRIYPASLLKVPAALAVMKKVERGKWSFETTLEITDRSRDKLSGTLWQKPVGAKVSVEELLTAMLQKSDNTAYRVFVENLSFEEIVEPVDALGLEDLITEEGKISAKEYTRFFRTLYVSSFLQRKYSEKVLDLLQKTEFNDFLRAGIPKDVVFSNKFGIQADLNVYLNSGIVYVKNRPYMITVAIQGTGGAGESDKVKGLMKEIGEKTYLYVAGQ